MSTPHPADRHHLRALAQRITRQHVVVIAIYVLAMASVMTALHLDSLLSNSILLATTAVGVVALARIAEHGAVVFGIYVMASIGLGFGFGHLAVDAVLLTATMAGYALGDMGITRLTGLTAGAH